MATVGTNAICIGLNTGLRGVKWPVTSCPRNQSRSIRSLSYVTRLSRFPTCEVRQASSWACRRYHGVSDGAVR